MSLRMEYLLKFKIIANKIFAKEEGLGRTEKLSEIQKNYIQRLWLFFFMHLAE